MYACDTSQWDYGYCDKYYDVKQDGRSGDGLIISSGLVTKRSSRYLKLRLNSEG